MYLSIISISAYALDMLGYRYVQPLKVKTLHSGFISIHVWHVYLLYVTDNCRYLIKIILSIKKSPADVNVALLTYVQIPLYK